MSDSEDDVVSVSDASEVANEGKKYHVWLI